MGFFSPWEWSYNFNAVNIFEQTLEQLERYSARERECFLAVEIWYYLLEISEDEDQPSMTVEYTDRIIKAIRDEYNQDTGNCSDIEIKSPVVKITNTTSPPYPVNTVKFLQMKVLKDPEFLNNIMGKANVDTMAKKYEDTLKSYTGDEKVRQLVNYIWKELIDLSNKSKHEASKEFSWKLLDHFRRNWKLEHQKFLQQASTLAPMPTPAPAQTPTPTLVDPNIDVFENIESINE